MADLLSREPGVVFFLCTDDHTVKNKLEYEFGNSIITRNIPLSRSDEVGMRQAVVDMYLLARTTKIICSYHSSFSLVASELSGTPIEILTTS